MGIKLSIEVNEPWYEEPGDVPGPCHFRCLYCADVLRTEQAIGNHLSAKHGIQKGMGLYGIHWIDTGARARNANQRKRVRRRARLAKELGNRMSPRQKQALRLRRKTAAA